MAKPDMGDTVTLLTLSTTTIITQRFAFLTKMLGVLLCLVRYVEAIRFVKWSLLMRVHVDVAFDTHLSHVSPAIAAHPLALATWAFVFAKASFFPLIRCKSFAFWSCLHRQTNKTIALGQLRF